MNNPEIISRVFVSFPEMINKIDEDENSLLNVSVINNCWRVFKFLVRFPTLNPNFVNKYGCSPIHSAMKRKRKRMISILVRLPTIEINFNNRRIVFHFFLFPLYSMQLGQKTMIL